MRTTRLLGGCVVLLALLLLAACTGPGPAPTPTFSQSLLDTMVAATLQALTPPTLTPTPNFPLHFPAMFASCAEPCVDQLLAAASITPSPSPSPTITQTPTPSLPPPSPTAQCNAARFIQDVNFPRGTVVAPGQRFTKIWRVQNVGSCTWDSTYSLIPVTADALNAPPRSYLRSLVPPGAVVDLTVDLQAPNRSGMYRTGFMLFDGKNSVFGVGPSFLEPLWVEVAVLATPTPTRTVTMTPTRTPTVIILPSTTVPPTVTFSPTPSFTVGPPPTDTDTPTPTPSETATLAAP
jgi:hypothetical protein